MKGFARKNWQNIILVIFLYLGLSYKASSFYQGLINFGYALAASIFLLPIIWIAFRFQSGTWNYTRWAKERQKEMEKDVDGEQFQNSVDFFSDLMSRYTYVSIAFLMIFVGFLFLFYKLAVFYGYLPEK